MTKRSVSFSDLTDAIILDENQHATLTVLKHPALVDGPVTIEALVSELKAADKHSLDVAIFDLQLPGEEPRRVVMQLAAFDALAKDRDMAEVLKDATPAKQPRQSAPKSDRVDYTTPDRFGQVHRGKITEEEARLVRENLAQANANRERIGQPTIDVNDSKEQARYGLKYEGAFS